MVAASLASSETEAISSGPESSPGPYVSARITRSVKGVYGWVLSAKSDLAPGASVEEALAALVAGIMSVDVIMSTSLPTESNTKDS